MRVLIVTMAAIAETAGPFNRCKMLAEEFKQAGIEVATCIADDVNYKPIDGIENYFLDIPMPLGLPKFIATKTFPIAQKTGITARKKVVSFDQVLTFTGNLDYHYLKKSVSSIQKAIKLFKPDIVYSEFNISAFIAARLEEKRIFTTVSYPTQPFYANNPILANGLNRLLKEKNLSTVSCALELFDWAEKSFCPSIAELEPIETKKVTFTGAWKRTEEIEENKSETNRKKVLVYMGNGTISPRKMENVITEAFRNSNYEVYIASHSLTEKKFSNINVAKSWEFSKLLSDAVLFINHGGQNSVIDGLLYGVPQLIIPGKVFERCYNAQSIVNNHAGKLLIPKDFQAKKIKEAVESMIADKEMRQNAKVLGKKLMSQGGIKEIIGFLK